MDGSNRRGTTRSLLLAPVPGWVILPLRFFLAFSFIAAGWDKLTDPAFLNPAALGYIGNQISQMAAGTPLEGFLNNIAAPNANLFGVLVMGGELLIGIAVLLGALTRFSALMGMLLNLTFFLSATWNIHPFYFGADLPYMFLWLTLLLAGPGPLAIDTLIRRWVSHGTLSAPSSAVFASPQAPGPRQAPAPGRSPGIPAASAGVRSTRPQQSAQARATRYTVSPQVSDPEEVLTRRAFVGVGAAGLGLVGLLASGLGWGLLHANARAAQGTALQGGPGSVAPTRSATRAGQQPSPTAMVSAPPTAPNTQPPAAVAPTDTAAPAPSTAGKQLIAAPGAVPQGQAIEFQLPTGQPAILEHNSNGYSAYVAICTHEGCEVRPIQDGYIGCPCHGAIFDSKQGGSVVRGPARRPLSSVPIEVGADGGVYLAG